MGRQPKRKALMGFSVEEDVKELKAKVIILENQVRTMADKVMLLDDMITKKGGIIHVEEKTDDPRGLS